MTIRKHAPGKPGYPFCQPGDVFFARGTATFGRLIRWAERSKNEDESWANHVGGILTPGYMVPPTDDVTSLATATESLWHVEENVWWERHKNEQGYAVAVFRPRNYSGNEGVKRATDNWHSRLGERYGWWRIGTFLGEKLTGGLIPFSKLHVSKTRVVCSNHILIGLEEDNISVNNHDPNEIDPDEFMDYAVATEATEWKFVGQAIVPARRAT